MSKKIKTEIVIFVIIAVFSLFLTIFFTFFYWNHDMKIESETVETTYSFNNTSDQLTIKKENNSEKKFFDKLYDFFW
ncbi:MAG: hypothetical protein LBM93_08110 [Oscillospiraceae bacterium]|jgi:hypothetical protein|nr:hypothetical protein [Oscillospiraceae bacterium]